MVQLLGYLPGVRAPDLPDVGNALNRLGESVRYYRSESDKARAYDDAQEQKRYARGRAAAGDGDERKKAFGQAALKLSGMPDDDPMKGKIWESLLKRSGSSDLTPEQLDFRTGPKLMAAEAGLFNDPYEQEERKLKLDKLRREASGQGAGSSEYGLMPQYAQDADGNFVPWVPGKAGEPKVIQLPNGLKALAPADTAFQRSFGKERGEAMGQAQVDLPRQTDNAGLALKTIESIRNHPGKSSGVGFSAPMGYVPNTEARGFANLVDQAKGQTFLEAFNSLRGGGQITEAEGAKATQALSRLDRYQSQADFDAALKDLEDVIKAGLARAQAKAAGPAMPSRATNGTQGVIDYKSRYGLE